MTETTRPVTTLERLACVAALCLGLWVLGSWWLGHPDLSRVLPGKPPTQPSVAAWMFLVGLALPLGDGGRRARRLSALMAGLSLVLALGLLLLTFVPAWVAIPLPYGWTSVSLALVSLSLLLRDHPWRPDLDLGGSFALLATLVPYSALMGHTLEVAGLYQPPLRQGTSLPSALVLVLLSLAIVASRPEHVWATLWRKANVGGALLRNQTPTVLIAPLVIGVMSLAGARAHLFPVELTIGFVLILTALAAAALTLWTARSLDGLEEARLAAVKDLQASEAMFRSLMEGASDAILVMDAQGRIAFVNRQVGSLFGYGSGELIGQSMECLMPDRFRQSHGAHVASYFKAPRSRSLDASLDLSALRKDGSEFHAEISLSPVETVEGQFVMVLVRDLTERRKAAEAIARLNAQLQRRNEEIEAEIVARIADQAREHELIDRAIAHIPAGVAFVDPDLTFRWVNPEFGRQLRMPPGEVVQRSVQEMLPTFDLARFVDLERLQAGQPVILAGAPLVRGQETTYWDASLVPYVKEGEYQGCFLLANEVTARIELERMHRDHIAALERADALKDEFLNIVSHELRTPIAILSGTISLLEYEVDGPLSEAQRRDIARLRESTDHLLTLVNELLDMSMIHAGKLAIVPKPLPVVELIEGAIDFVRPLALERRIAIRTEVAPDLPEIAADSQRIRQVVINLVTNALKYSPAESAVAIRIGADETGLRCEVADEGPGVRPEDQARIFEKFTRAASVAHEEGAGLGLYICRALVEAHRGDIGVVSDGKAGSTFWFTLPRAR